MGTVLSLIDDEAARATFDDWEARSEHEVITDQEPRSSSYDCCLVDWSGLVENVGSIREGRAAASPVDLPCVLVVSERLTRRAGPDLHDHVEAMFPGTVDAILGRPLRGFELASTVDRLLESRARSREMSRTRDRLKRFQRAAAAMPHAYYLTDPDGTIEYVNPGFERITGYDATEAIGETPAILNSGVQDTAYYRDLWETLQSGEVWTEELINERKNGERYYADQTIVPITDEDGRIEWYAAIQTDVTQRENRTRQLEVLDRVLRHNLSNDLNVIMGRAELIAHHASGQVAEQAAVILDRSERLVETARKERSIVQTIVDDQEPRPQDLADIVERVIEATRDRYPRATVELSASDRAAVSALPRIDRAVAELLENAIVHADAPRPHVEITISTGSEDVDVTVADHGPGIPEPEAAILDGSSDVEPLFHGQGLGLWLVNWIVYFSEGSITVDQQPPTGTAVRLTLPQSETGPERQPAVHDL